MEHSDRGRYVTEQVSLWIQNDGEFVDDIRRRVDVAREIARRDPELLDLAAYLSEIIRHAMPYTAPWQVAQELAPNDYDRIDWQSIARDLLEDDENPRSWE